MRSSNFLKLIYLASVICGSLCVSLLRGDHKLQSSISHQMDWSDYRSLEEINDYLEYLTQNYSNIVRLMPIGESSEGRPLNLVRVSSNFSSNNPAIWIDGGIHSREWISPAVVTYFINQLVEMISNRDLISKVDYYIIPVVNPDGYKFSIASDKMWRKNRASTSRTACVGTDLNRNFDIHWMETGSSSDPCSNTYAGPRAFSEPESQAVANFIKDKVDQIKMYLTFHSHGQYWLVPYGYDVVFPPDYDDMLQLAEKAAAKTKKFRYTVGNTAKTLYPSAGGSDDWAKSIGIKYSYTIELPPDHNVRDRFLPREDILPVAQDFFPALRVLIEEISTLTNQTI